MTEHLFDHDRGAVGFSSVKQDWATPRALFDAIDAEFGFSLDAAATAHNAKCPNYLSPDDNALALDWTERSGGGAVWLNPPYGREVGAWIGKAAHEARNGLVVVCLTFARTDTRWWAESAMRAAEIRFLTRRVRFEGAPAGAPAPSCLLVFDEGRRVPAMRQWSPPRT